MIYNSPAKASHGALLTSAQVYHIYIYIYLYPAYCNWKLLLDYLSLNFPPPKAYDKIRLIIMPVHEIH